MIKLKEQTLDVKSGILRIPKKILSQYPQYSKLHLDVFHVSSNLFQFKINTKRSEKVAE